ncbi:MAG: zinc ribbon domain-containing protein [Verrucomicrobiaceae bacterium]|nr:zinc ribbon domain-containing protein [Verrucomicrobiaceae bacterium]
MSVLLLGLIGPVVSFARWHNWDAMRWTLKILSWSLMLGALLYMRREPRLLSWLRFVPWMTLAIITFLSWIAFITGKITSEITVQVGWCLVVGGLFLTLRRRYPNHFSATAYLDYDPQPMSPMLEPSSCVSCQTIIPPDSDTCPKCGWTYKTT